MIRNDDQTKQNIRYKDKNKKLNNIGARFHVYVCNKCNCVFEQNPFLNEDAKVFFYKDFPTYKLERKQCIYCK